MSHALALIAAAALSLPAGGAHAAAEPTPLPRPNAALPGRYPQPPPWFADQSPGTVATVPEVGSGVLANRGACACPPGAASGQAAGQLAPETAPAAPVESEIGPQPPRGRTQYLPQGSTGAR
jgi:hypothetical protein